MTDAHTGHNINGVHTPSSTIGVRTSTDMEAMERRYTKGLAGGRETTGGKRRAGPDYARRLANMSDAK